MVRRVGLVVVAALALLATGCGDEGDVTGSADSAAWRTSTDPVTTSGLPWAVGSTVHLSDGTSIDTGTFVRSFVVAGDGVFFVPTDTEEEAGSNAFFDDEELMFAAPGQPVTGTGLRVSPDYVGASEDGRYLAVIETTSGEKDRFGTPQATVVAFDLETGEQVVDSTLGMGDPGEDDFADGYAEAEMEITALTGTSLYVRAMGNFVFDLATGEGKELAGDPPRAGDELTSPDGTWVIEKPETGMDRIVATDGREVPLDPGTRRWFVSWWADAETVVGGVISGPGTGKRVTPDGSAALMTCAVPSGECQVFDETAGRTVVFSIGRNLPNAITLPGAGSS